LPWSKRSSMRRPHAGVRKFAVRSAWRPSCATKAMATRPGRIALAAAVPRGDDWGKHRRADQPPRSLRKPHYGFWAALSCRPGNSGTELPIEVDGVSHQVDRDDGGVVHAPAPAVVVSVLVKPGDMVATGDRLAVLEAMKMETQILAPFAGKVRQVMAIANVQVDTGAPLLQIDNVGAVDAVGRASACSSACLAHLARRARRRKTEKASPADARVSTNPPVPVGL